MTSNHKKSVRAAQNDGRDESDNEQSGEATIPDGGEFRVLPKKALNIDHSYQRELIRHSRINRIASDWNFQKCGVLVVAQRPDGTYWVVDGQHRKLAADLLDHICELPCLVYQTDNATTEAALYLAYNTDRGRVMAFDKFKSELAAQDPIAMAVLEMVERSGYTISRGGHRNTVQCPAALKKAVSIDAEAATVAWEFAVEIYDGEPVVEKIFLAFHFLERFLKRKDLGTLRMAKYRDRIKDIGVDAIITEIGRVVHYHGANHSGKAFAEAIVRLLNAKRRNRIPSLYSETSNDGG